MRVLVDFLGLFASRHLEIWTMLEIFALSLGWIFALTFPMSVLVAVVVAFGRLPGRRARRDPRVRRFVSADFAPVLVAATVLTAWDS